MKKLQQIIKLLQNVADHPEYNEDMLVSLAHLIKHANHIFVAGAGRSGLSISMFANRLMHLGLKVNLISEITKPKAVTGDLLILCSASGETGSLINYAKKAKTLGVKVALVTKCSESTLAKLSDFSLILPIDNHDTSYQPMGALFEQMTVLLFDAIVLHLVDILDENFDTMSARHANIE